MNLREPLTIKLLWATLACLVLSLLPAPIRAQLVLWPLDFTAAGGALAVLGNFRPWQLATHVLVKDNFEYGPYSRKMLQLADFVGNCLGEGGSVPERYFTREGFVRLAAQQDLVITALDSELDLYQHLPGMNTLLRRDWQFIAVLRCH